MSKTSRDTSKPRLVLKLGQEAASSSLLPGETGPRGLAAVFGAYRSAREAARPSADLAPNF